jgi:hypothetical protein
MSTVSASVSHSAIRWLGPDPRHCHRPFGLNALGGSVNVQLKNGFTDHGFEADLSGGSCGQIQGEFQFGKQADTDRPMSPALCCTRMTGATCNPPICRIASAMSVGAVSAPRCTSMSRWRIPCSMAPVPFRSNCWPLSTRPVHWPRSDQQPVRRGQPHRHSGCNRHDIDPGARIPPLFPGASCQW